MEISEIIEAYKYYAHEHFYDKDGVVSFFEDFSKAILKLEDNDQQYVYRVLLSEIIDNKHGLYDFALFFFHSYKYKDCTTIDMEKIFSDYWKSKSDEWGRQLMLVLYKQRNVKNAKIYHDFVSHYIPDHPDDFPIIFYYMNSFPEQGTRLAVDYFDKRLIGRESISNDDCFDGYIYSFCSKVKNIEAICILIKSLADKNKYGAYILKKFLLSYYRINPSNLFKEDYINKVIENINAINIIMFVDDAIELFVKHARIQCESSLSGDNKTGDKSYDILNNCISFLSKNNKLDRLSAFLDDKDVSLRLWSASALLDTRTRKCKKVLKEIAEDNNYGALRLTAETVLSEHKKKDERHFFWRILNK
jgi:hypothetical protein